MFCFGLEDIVCLLNCVFPAYPVIRALTVSVLYAFPASSASPVRLELLENDPIPDHFDSSAPMIFQEHAIPKEVTPQYTSHPAIFFQAEDGIRDLTVTGVQTCALPI